MGHFLRRLFGLEPRVVFVTRGRSSDQATARRRQDETTAKLRREAEAQRNAAIQRAGVRGG